MFSADMRKKMTPSHLRCMNMCGVSYFVVVGILIVSTTYWISLPSVLPDEDLTWHKLLTCFFTASILLNFILTITNKGFYKQGMSERSGGLPDASWKDCPDCCHMMPARTHHCILCGHCVQKRDHHCFFTGCCVGQANQRYFTVFTFYCALGSIYGFYMLWTYIGEEYSNPLSYSFYKYLLPVSVCRWLFGYISFSFMFLIIVLYTSFTTAMGSFGIFIWQMFLITQGTTTFEFTKGTKCAGHGSVRRNIRAVFGPFWLFNFFIPCPFFKNTEDDLNSHYLKIM